MHPSDTFGACNRRDSPTLFEELLIDLLDMQRFLDPASDIMADHQTRELVAVDENNSFAQVLSSLFRRTGETGGRYG